MYGPQSEREPLELTMAMLTTEKLMLDNPKTVSPQTSILEARSLMKSEGTLQLPVLEEDKLVGIITDHDICLDILAPGECDQSVADFMTADPITVSPDTPIYKTAQVLSAYKFGALPVVVGDKLVGLITTSVLLAYFASNLDQQR